MNFFFSKNVIAPKKGCLIAGYLYWPVYLFVLSLVLALVLPLCGIDIESSAGYTVINLIYFSVNFIAVLLIFRKFLFESIREAKGRFLHIFLSALMAYGLCYILSLYIEFIYILLDLMPENMNQEGVEELLERAPWQMVICTVIFAPITEECLVRGLLFAPFAKKVPVLGYILSTLVFAGIHVLGSIGISDWLTILLCFIQYLPHSIALAWAYHRSGNILAPIMLHAFINLMSVIVQFSGIM